MKTKYIIFSLLLMAGLASCELVGDLDKMIPPHKMTDTNVINDPKSAEGALNGVYESWRNREIGTMRHYLDVLTGTEGLIDQLDDIADFRENTIKVDNRTVASNYTALYNVINTATSFLKNLNAKPDLKGLSSERRAQMKGEARYLRAQAYLMLLRQYGEFANTASEYGIVLYGDEPLRENKPVARSTVADSYKAIVADLDSAIMHAPESQPKHYRIGSLTAKAMKARVMLYMQKFKEAVGLAKEVIKQAPAAGYALEENYKKMFEKSYESSEMLFAIYSRIEGEEIYNGGDWFLSSKGPTIIRIAGSKTFDDGEDEGGDDDEDEGSDGGVDEGDNKRNVDFRFSQTWEDLNPEDETVKNNKYPASRYAQKQDSHYHIRLAEMFYILAEAEARLGNNKAAKEALKKIICLPRARYTNEYVDKIPDNELKKVILEQKWLEFNTENNEEWFDLVRYRVWDNFPIVIKRENSADNTKAGKIVSGYVRSDARLLLPIPRKAFVANTALQGKQNPGYSEGN